MVVKHACIDEDVLLYLHLHVDPLKLAFEKQNYAKCVSSGYNGWGHCRKKYILWNHY